LLAYSPIAFGVLSGKYLNGALPAGSRLSSFTRFSRYSRPAAAQAIADYVALANKHGISPVHLALAFVLNRPFVTSALSGATNLTQLTENLASIHVQLTPEILEELTRSTRVSPIQRPEHRRVLKKNAPAFCREL